MHKAIMLAFRDGKCCRPFNWRRQAIFWDGMRWRFLGYVGIHIPQFVEIPELKECLGPWEVVDKETVEKEMTEPLPQ